MVKNLVLENKKPVEMVEIVQQIEEKTIEKWEEAKEVVGIVNPKKMWAGISYIGSPDSNIWDELDKNITPNHNKHRGTSPFNHFCLGCLFTGGKYSGNTELNFTKTFQFSSGGRLVLETSESGTQELHIPSRGGVVKLEVKGNEVSLVLEEGGDIKEDNFVEKKLLCIPEEEKYRE